MSRRPVSRCSVSQRLRGVTWRYGAALFLAGSLVFGVACVPRAAASAGRSGTSRLELRTGAEYYSREWESLRGSFALTEYLLPVDVAWRTPGLRLSAGADFTRGVAELPGDPRTHLSLGEFRGASEFSFWRDRARAAIGTRVPSSTMGLGPKEARAAELLDEVSLGFPRAQHPGGPSLLLEAGGQVLRRTGYTLQLGTAWERRGSYEILLDGRRLDPGDLWKLAGGLTAGRGATLGDLGLRWETSGQSTLDGGFSYREGNTVTLRAGLRREFERGRLGLAGTVAARADGSTDAGVPMDVSALGGGNAGRLAVSGTRFTGAGDLGLSLGLLEVRSYPGALGSAWAFEPGVSWIRGLADGRLGLAVRGVWGHCRQDRPLRGLDASLSWQREWRP